MITLGTWRVPQVWYLRLKAPSTLTSLAALNYVLWALAGIPQFISLDIWEKQREERKDIIVNLAHVVGRTLENVLVDPDHRFRVSSCLGKSGLSRDVFPNWKKGIDAREVFGNNPPL